MHPFISRVNAKREEEVVGKLLNLIRNILVNEEGKFLNISSI